MNYYFSIYLEKSQIQSLKIKILEFSVHWIKFVKFFNIRFKKTQKLKKILEKY